MYGINITKIIGPQRFSVSAIKSLFIDGTVLRPWLTPEGAQVQLPDFDRIGPLIAEALAPPDTNRARQGLARVQVFNGTTIPNWAILAADRLGHSSPHATRRPGGDRRQEGYSACRGGAEAG